MYGFVGLELTICQRTLAKGGGIEISKFRQRSKYMTPNAVKPIIRLPEIYYSIIFIHRLFIRMVWFRYTYVV